MSSLPAPVFEEFTIASLQQTLPPGTVDQKLVDKVNLLANNHEIADTFKQNFISYTNVLSKGSFTAAQYISALQYVSYRLMGYDKRPSWEKTFPQRYAELLKKGASSKEIHAHASAYNKTKLVNLITEQTLIPSYIINNHYFQEALNIEVEIMRDVDVSPKVRSEAAKAVLEYTNMPDSVANRDEISEKGINIIEQLAKATAALAESQRDANKKGITTVEEAARKPIYTLDQKGNVLDD